MPRSDELTRQSMPVSAGCDDEEGCLVLQGGRLVAVLVKLSALHGDLAGGWYLEAGFGLLDSYRASQEGLGEIREGPRYRDFAIAFLIPTDEAGPGE